jgi:asparagine synthase (glutamine-hydrolysing)
MCGIAGILGEKGNKQNLKDMLKVQNHRGPDYTGSWFEKDVFIGHNRLAIIDLREKSNQPFLDNSGRYILVFNGEIYNFIELKKELEGKYDFKTNSDTEVLLASYLVWGKKCLSKLNGMFSFAIYDKKNEVLFAARDRFGVKPFYYHYSNGTLYFASEIKAIHAAQIRKKPNKKTWASYFVYGSYGQPNETFWEGIEQLPGGHLLEYQKGLVTVSKWYDFENEIKKQKIGASLEEVKKKYADLLRDSIKIRFRADVNVGFNISGGLDSSTLLAFVNLFQENKGDKERINAYTFYTGDENYDEIPWVEEMIETTQNPLKKVLLNVENIKGKIGNLSYHQYEPFGGIPTIAYSEIFKKAKKDNILVLLDGQGMDEQWAGYDYYTKNTGSTIQGVKKSPFKANVLSEDFLKLAEKPEYPTPFENDLLNLQFRDIFYTKIPRALRFNDRVSMMYSTELREPFLDYRLVEYAFSQPLEYKIQNGIQKFLLREIVSEYLSDTISYAPKRPLQTPQREWLGNELRDYVDTEINKIVDSSYSQWFDIKELKKSWKEYKEGDNSSSFHIWQWISLSNLLIE